MENIETIPESNKKNHSWVIYVLIVVFILIFIGFLIAWQLSSKSNNKPDQNITSTVPIQMVAEQNYTNFLEVPFLKHPALARTSVLYTLKGFIKRIDEENIVLGSSGPDLTFKLSSSTKYGRGGGDGKPLQQITKKDIKEGAEVWVYPEYNPKLKQLDLLWVVLNNVKSNESTPSGLTR